MAFGFDTILPQAAGNALSTATQKLQESASKVVKNFGGVGLFTKVTAASDSTIKNGAADAQNLLAQMKASNVSPEQASAAITDKIASIKGSTSLNAMTFSAAQD